MPDDDSERSPTDGSLYRTVAPSLDRRKFLKTTATGALVTGGIPSSVHAQERTFTISQPNGFTHEVTALSGPEPIEEFYGGSSQFSSTRLEQNETSHLFLYDGPNGLSLVVIHDAPTDGEDGAVSFDFTGLPTTEGEWIVQDDGGDFDSATDTSVDWRWPAYPHKDGAHGGVGSRGRSPSP